MDTLVLADKENTHTHQLSGEQYWNLTIRLFSVKIRPLVGVGILSLCREAVDVDYSSRWLDSDTVTEYELKAGVF